MWVPNIPLLVLQAILAIMTVVSAYKDREYVRKYYDTGKTDKRTNFWTIMFMICLIGNFLGVIGQVYSFLAEVAP